MDNDGGGRGSRGNGRGWKGGGYRGGRWRGRGQYNRGGGWGRGNRNGGRGAEDQSSENLSGGENTPPPPKRKQNDQENTIRMNVTNHWRKLLPGYDHYYWEKVPQLPDFEKKVEAVEVFLSEIKFAEDALQEMGEGARGIRRESYYSIQFDEAVKNERLLAAWPNIATDLIDEPEETIALWGVTAHKSIHSLIEKQDPKSAAATIKVPIVKIGFTKLKPVTPVKQIKAGLLGKFVTIKGAIVRTGNIHPYCQRLTFHCRVCETEFAVEQPEGKYSCPVICKSEDCKNNNTFLFEVRENAKSTLVIDSRKIRIQDILNRDKEESGSVPRTIDCLLFGDLSEQCSTGDAVTLCGIVKMTKDTGHAGEQTLHHIYIEASSIIQHKDSESMGGNMLNFTNKDYYMIKEIHDTPDLFRLLIASLCPSIFGHELVKAGLLLCLFGGTPRDSALVSRRSDINMLMVGDPGIGKSQMLKVLQDVAPRAVYVCGTGSTTAGLTVTLVKDGDDFSVEAGALVMADRGVCCIDEFDKMPAQHNALLEAMEQQSVSIAKAGVFRTLSARATVIAAANPVGGHYDVRKTVSENIKIKQPLMSRFDLIFILLDRPDEEFDQRLVDHVKPTQGNKTGRSVHVPSRMLQQSRLGEDVNLNLLINRVRIRPGEVFDLIPHPLLRKYIAYAKQYVNPRLSKEASELLKKYYLNLRLTHRGANSTPVTARQLESLVRLTEARAKLELREVATEDDAKDILELYDFSLSSVFDDEVHAVSALSESVLMHSSGSSRKSKSTVSQAKELISSLQTVARKQSKNIFSVDEINDVAGALGYRDKCSSLIATLNNEGFLLKKGAKVYQLQTADY